MDRNRITKALLGKTIKAEGHRTELKLTSELGRGGNGAAFLATSAKRELVAKFYVPPDGRDLDDASYKRFRREIELTSRVKHPYVIASEGVGTIVQGSYSLPFYLMKRAQKTMRDIVPKGFQLNDLAWRLQFFTRVIQGVAYLHHHEIVHRDLKPENILIIDGIPKVADLGIAHVSPRFASGTQLTLPKDRLMNRDYYAPEQRGDANLVDHRADIYALGCMLYELVTGIPPTRPNLPALKDFHSSLSSLDRVLNKMIAHVPTNRYSALDTAFDDLVWALVHSGIPTTPPLSDAEDEKLLNRFLSSTNPEMQAKAIEPVARLGAKALPILHEKIGNRRLDVASGAFRIIGELADESSIPFLVAALYPRRNSKTPNFSCAPLAAQSLSEYPKPLRLKALQSIQDMVRAQDVAVILDNFEKQEAFDLILKFHREDKFFSHWDEPTAVAYLVKLDSKRAWEHVEQLIQNDASFGLFRLLRDIFPSLAAEQRRRVISHYLTKTSSLYSWDLNRLLSAIVNDSFSKTFKLSSLDRLREVSEIVIKRHADRADFQRQLGEAIEEISPGTISARRKLRGDDLELRIN